MPNTAPNPSGDAAALRLRPLAAGDIAVVRAWPAYPPAFAAFDYALRQGGWLDEFCGRPATWCYMAQVTGAPVGFSLLATARPGDAELRLALHPAQLGRGLGGALVVATLAEAFARHGLRRIHLLVRPGHLRARRLYLRQGFAECGSTSRSINGEELGFVVMERFAPAGEGLPCNGHC